MAMQPITFDARLSSYCPGPLSDRYTDTGWDITLDGQNAKSGELHTAHVKMHGYGACPFNPANQDARVRVTVEILTPKTRVVPWKPEQVPFGCWMRWSDPETHPNAQALVSVGPTGVILAETKRLSYDYLAEKMEHSTDGGKTWLPAGRVEEVYE